ncbi:hypothetical protein [Brevundimonas sp. A19_0]|uniref:hypothetical protein n=1 Tax=Brevundimonas sp. A19_0 TaxID=2821087 RepID=UPI001ADD0429|nr:hypothetical protein [Brevundimonas sp. A19_0]MBO9500585.1 hypothetical protein [Brevundimonas sp. A19_0]
MSDQSNNTGGNGGGGGNAGLAFIVGGIVVVLAIVAYFVFSGGIGTQEKDVDVDVNLPEVSAPDVPTPSAE